MKPEDFRKLLIPPGTKISLISGEGGDWNWKNRPIGILEKYVVAQYPSRIRSDKPEWDASVIMALDKPVEARGIQDNRVLCREKTFVVPSSPS